jgi:soluble lytic murein transglycosylase-like protein
MAIDSLNQISNEQLLAMNMMGNGQVTNDSDSTSSTSDETNLAFQEVMQNLLESSKNSKKNNVATLSDSVNSVNSQASSANNLSTTDSINAGNGIVNANNVARVAQQYATGQNLEDIPMILNNRYMNLAGKSGTILSNRSDVDMQKIYNAVSTASKKYGVDSNLILAIIKQESGFDPNSTSSCGASGLMQIMPQNFAHAGVTDEYDVDQNINGGTKLFKEYLNKFDGNTEMALMAYNGGPGTMQKRGVSSAADLYKMPQETQNYVPKVMGYYRNGV